MGPISSMESVSSNLIHQQGYRKVNCCRFMLHTQSETQEPYDTPYFSQAFSKRHFKKIQKKDSSKCPALTSVLNAGQHLNVINTWLYTSRSWINVHIYQQRHLIGSHIERERVCRRYRNQLLNRRCVRVNGIFNHLATVRTSLASNKQMLQTGRQGERNAKNPNFNPNHTEIEKHGGSKCVSPSCYQYSRYTGEDRQQSCIFFCKYAYNLL